MYLMATHRGFAGVEGGAHVQVRDFSDTRTLRIGPEAVSQRSISDVPLARYTVAQYGESIALSRSELFACAVSLQERIAADRTEAATWEAFLVVRDQEIGIHSQAGLDLQ